ncbi:MAG: hypothetical protein KHZ72_10540 [Lachnospiraceae bacterium]|nr:hypothetical protein [Lachnospiraceae bacterium]
MNVKNIIVIGDKEKEFEELSAEEHKKLENRLNTAALRQVCYTAERQQKPS